MKLSASIASLMTLAWAVAAQAQLRIEITSGVTDPIPVAVVPFSSPPSAALDVAAVVQHDLEGSGRFKALPRGQMPEKPTRGDEVTVSSWRGGSNDYVVVGRVSPMSDGQLAVDFDLINILNGQRMVTQRFTAAPNALRNAAHRVSDVVYQKILGVRGAFATRIAYVSVTGQVPALRYKLMVADTDGENMIRILESAQPIMSPAWSADGQWLAYVSFEGKKSAIFVQRVRTGERRRVSQRAGINGAPAWSPDGSKLALTLSGRGGNLDIYVLELASQNLTRITDDPSIDTEPAWTPDGGSLYFTSDRAGGPQIYRAAARAGERPKRITFTGSYNARPRLSPDGTQLAMVTLDQSAYRIGVQDLATGTVRVLSKGKLDESPSFAPNGAALIYSGQEHGRGVLATVSIDGLTGQRLNSDAGQVREPVWGPFAQ